MLRNTTAVISDYVHDTKKFVRAAAFGGVLVAASLALPSSADAQQWSGIIDPSRAIDWNPGATIPTNRTICSTLGTPGQPHLSCRASQLLT